MHDFKDKQLGKAIPYGVYDIGTERGLGERRDRPRHRPVRGQLDPQLVGAPRPAALPERHRRCRSPPTAAAPTATAPGCGRSSCRSSPTRPASRSPSATSRPAPSKWNKIEHRCSRFITMNWRGKPLVSLETIINLIGATTTSTGLEVYARLDNGTYPDKIKVTDAETQRRQPPRRRVPSRMELHHQTEMLIIYKPLVDQQARRYSHGPSRSPTSRSTTWPRIVSPS